MSEITTFNGENEEKINRPIKRSLKIKHPPQCHLIAPNEKIKFDKREMTNIGKTSILVCEASENFTEEAVLDRLQKRPFYKDFAKMRDDVIKKCQIEQKLPQSVCSSQKYIQKHMLVQTDTDSFSIRNGTNPRTLYVSNLLAKLYPPTKNEHGEFENKYHVRASHYRLLSEGIGFPVFESGKGYALKRYDGSNKMYNVLKEAITEGRNAGLIPMKQIFDARVIFEPRPLDFKLGQARDDKFQPNLTFDLNLNKNFDLDIDAPVIMFYSEKSELKSVLDHLTSKYANISYMLGKGHISVSNAAELYQYIKTHGQNAILYTLTDFDETGLEIAQTLARKIQFHIQNDTSENKPQITVQQFAISPKDAKALEKKGVEMGIKIYKRGEGKSGKKIYELAALEILARSDGIPLSEWFENELKNKIKPNSLISKEQIKTRRKNEEERLKDKIEANLNHLLEKVPRSSEIVNELRITPVAEGKFEIDDYIDGLNHYIETLPSFQVLKKSVKATSFEPEDIIQKSLGFMNKEDDKLESLLWHEENDSYKKATERLIKFRTDTKGIIKLADPEEQLKKEEQQKLDVHLKYTESDEELTTAILKILDVNDRIESYHVMTAILNEDETTPRNLYVGKGGQLSRVIQQLKHDNRITYLPVQVGSHKKGWYKGQISIPTLTAKITRPIFKNRLERTNWEISQYQTKEKAKEALIAEAKRLYASKNPDTGKFWRLEEIGISLGGYSASPVYSWLK